MACTQDMQPPTASLISSACPTQVLESVIKTRWGALPDEQREVLKTYISNLIIKLSTDEVGVVERVVTVNCATSLFVPTFGCQTTDPPGYTPIHPPTHPTTPCRLPSGASASS